MKKFILCLAVTLVSFPLGSQAQILRISAESETRQSGSEVEADYTTTHVFVDEVAGDSIPITIFFDPQTLGVESAEVFTNLNRRDRADDDANSDGIQDGILGPDGNTIVAGDDSHYYKAFTMNVGADGYYLTLYANKTGAYRLTARYRLNGDTPGTYRWYGNRDHAIVVSPTTARDIRLYEINTLNIEASGTQFSQRSTFEDLSDRPGAIHTTPGRANNWNLDYASSLGINWLWFQPYHPYGWEGRHESSANINSRAPGSNSTTWLWNGGSTYEDVNYPFALGSPYAVKNFWEIDPRLSATFAGDPTDIAQVSAQSARDAAMVSFQNFVTDADAAGINIMPDAAFNHTAWDVELGDAGIATDNSNPNVSWMAAQGASGWSKTDLIHDRELRVFSRNGDYRLRASYYNSFFDNNIAPAPDRTDFGKWLDVCDIFFGRYAALVGAQDGSEQENYKNEGDWIDTTEADWNGSTGGSFDAFTRATWYYFAQYAPYWLGKTRPAGQNRNSTSSDGDASTRYAWDARGIDGLRCDFGQGLPPQAWEYIINVARSYKWSFVFMAETLDGGAPPYRSNRHFDILNENILFAAKGAGNKYDFVNMFESRRNSFGQGLVLLNTVSHDEDNYGNPWDAAARFAIFSSVDGAPMIFPGQELGISTFFGYDLMEKNFGKYIPHFKTYNSMMPLWNDTDFGNDQLYNVYAAINAARAFSPALRSSNRWFIDGNGFNNQLYGVAKYTNPNAALATQDVVFAFANLDRLNDQSDTYVIPSALADLIGLQDGRTYNVKNIAAYLNDSIGMTGRRDQWLWGSGISGSDLKSGGFFVGLNKVPTLTTSANPTDPAWNQKPYEAQYLKVYDITAPTNVPANIEQENLYHYAIGDQAFFDWEDVSADAGGVVPHYEVNVTINGSPAGSFITDISEYTVDASEGDMVSITVKTVNPDYNTNKSSSTSPSSQTIALLNAGDDDDGDGMSNGDEDNFGTDPLDKGSKFKFNSVAFEGENDFTFTWDAVPGRSYSIQASETMEPGSWTTIATGLTSGTFTDIAPSTAKRFYRIIATKL
jgi:predicted RNA-binding protein with TRAM domain